MKTTISPIIIILVMFWSICMLQSAFSQESDPIWKFARSTSNATIKSMLTDSVGNCYMAGTFMSSQFRYGNDSVPGTANESTNTFVLKTDPTGKLIWLHSFYPLSTSSEVNITKLAINQRGEAAIAFTVNGSDSIIVGNQVISTQTPGIATYIVKLLKNKTIGWIHQINSTPYYSNNGMITASDMFMDETGDLYVTGYFNGSSAFIDMHNIPGNREYASIFITRIEPSGNVAWLRGCVIDTTMGRSNIWSTTIKNSPGNSFYISGYHDGNQYFHFGNDTLRWALGQDAYVARYSKDGNSFWAQSFRGDGIDLPDNIAVLENGDAVFMGFSNSNVLNIGGNYFYPSGLFNLYLVKYHSNATIANIAEVAIQRSAVGSPGTNAFLSKDRDDNLIVCGEFQSPVLFSDVFSMSNPDPGTDEMFIVKMNNSTLTPLWTYHITAPGYNDFESVSADQAGNIFFSGTTYADLNLGPVTIVGDASEGSFYTASINTNGTLNYSYFQLNDATNHMQIKSTATDIYGNAFIAGQFTGPSNSLGTHDITNKDLDGVFLAKYSRVKDINGFVHNNLDEPVNQGYVKIYGYTYYQKSPLNDSVLINPDGSFNFTEIPYGRYIIMAQPTDDAAEHYVRTYFPSAFYWEFSQQLIVDADHPDQLVGIILKPAYTFEGITAMDGNVSDDAETKNMKAAPFDKGRPVKRAEVVLAGNQRQQKTTYEVVATTETDDEGNFAFYNVTDGDYFLWVDYPGLPVQNIYMVTVSGHQFISNLDYIVTAEVVTSAGFPQYSALRDPQQHKDIEIYPNPCNEYLTVDLATPLPVIIDIFDSKGSCIQHNTLPQGKEHIDMSSLEQGDYLIRIMYDDTIVFDKISVVR